jgi:hypothetical protein
MKTYEKCRILVFSYLCGLALAYHIDRTATLSGLSNIVKVNAVKEDTLIVQSSTSTITVLKGNSF